MKRRGKRRKKKNRFFGFFKRSPPQPPPEDAQDTDSHDGETALSAALHSTLSQLQRGQRMFQSVDANLAIAASLTAETRVTISLKTKTYDAEEKDLQRNLVVLKNIRTPLGDRNIRLSMTELAGLFNELSVAQANLWESFNWYHVIE